jgi:hypothetical protein
MKNNNKKPTQCRNRLELFRKITGAVLVPSTTLSLII